MSVGVNLLAAELVGTLQVDVVALGIDLHAGFRLEVQVTVEAGGLGLDVVLLKVDKLPVGDGDYEVAEQEDHQGHDDGAVEIGSQQAAVADAGAQDGDNLGVAGHLGSEEEHGDEDEQRAVEVDEARDEVAVVVEDHLAEGGVVREELVELLADVESDDNDNNQSQGQQESLDVLG